MGTLLAIANYRSGVAGGGPGPGWGVSVGGSGVFVGGYGVSVGNGVDVSVAVGLLE
ncbi:MAG: hypothetical protein WD906_06435 [Anaerolineales bacterium]